MLRQIGKKIISKEAIRPLAPLAARRGLKETTGIVGLEVDPHARQTLTKNLHEIKKMLKDSIPETAYYRQSIEEYCDEKLKMIEETESDEALEDKIGFQLEQVIEFTKDEMRLIPKMAVWKPWEVPEGYEVPVYDNEDPFDTGHWKGPPGIKQEEPKKPAPF